MSAAAIFDHLGGRYFQTTVLARDFSYPQNGLAFRLARATANGIDRVLIMPSAGQYVVTFFHQETEIATTSVAGDQLRATFARYTGL